MGGLYLQYGSSHVLKLRYMYVKIDYNVKWYKKENNGWVRNNKVFKLYYKYFPFRALKQLKAGYEWMCWWLAVMANPGWNLMWQGYIVLKWL